MFGAITEAVSRRRALLIAPLAAVRSSAGSENVNVTIVEFDDAGRKIGTAVRK